MDTTVDWFTRSLNDIAAFLPDLVAGIVILLLGYVIALLLAKITRALATRLRFDGLMTRLGLSERRERRTPSHFLGSVVFVVVLVVAAMQACRVWGLLFVADGLARIIGYVPHVLAAAVVFAIAMLLGNWVRDRMTRRAGAGGETRPGFNMMPSVVRGGILAIGSFMALRELQIAPEIVNAAFIAAVFAVSVAVALAFGLGGRDTAAQISKSWYERRRRERTVDGPPRVMDIPTRPPEARM